MSDPLNFRIKPTYGIGDAPVPVGDFAAPRRFSATIEPGDPDRPRCELDIAIEEGRPVCTALRVDRPNGAPVTSTLLRSLPLQRYIEEATAAALLEYETTSGVTTFSPPPIGSDFDAHVDAVRGTRRQPRRGIPITDDDLRAVADIYRRALERGKHPTAAVMAAHHVARATASRWIARARARGYLGKATPRKAGEQS